MEILAPSELSGVLLIFLMPTKFNLETGDHRMNELNLAAEFKENNGSCLLSWDRWLIKARHGLLSF